MLYISLFLAAFAALAVGQEEEFVPAPGVFPVKGDNTIIGGIFASGHDEMMSLYPTFPVPTPGPEAPAPGSGVLTQGSGPYPAKMYTDPTLPNHTVYAPINCPRNVKMPFLSWANGDCAMDGATYRYFLTEVASWGYVIAADGIPGGINGTLSFVHHSRESVDWAMSGGASKYGKIDRNKIAATGHSCGGLEALSMAYHDERVKQILMFDIGIFSDTRRYLLQEIKVPIAWFMGGLLDLGYVLAEKDYPLTRPGVPAFKANLDAGHYGTFQATNGGKYAKAAVAYLQWQFRHDHASKEICTNPSYPNSLVSQNWEVVFKNYNGV
ncbi:uncharacterized protein BP5553_06483 [Venustampulla echinocandica]|uniref:Chlorophyllase n=1 Tax=Venustampulla echinocandica TaxID=2656787 RepID=A0A370TK14_9HELO|nr:uncharacterized protein BP5553_06483 [Venustampulla echinocandica]RDL35871.1 hypothetical protein BP5553_06483 [Venustampulla echinocandica]